MTLAFKKTNQLWTLCSKCHSKTVLQMGLVETSKLRAFSVSILKLFLSSYEPHVRSWPSRRVPETVSHPYSLPLQMWKGMSIPRSCAPRLVSRSTLGWDNLLCHASLLVSSCACRGTQSPCTWHCDVSAGDSLRFGDKSLSLREF